MLKPAVDTTAGVMRMFISGTLKEGKLPSVSCDCCIIHGVPQGEYSTDLFCPVKRRSDGGVCQVGVKPG